MPNEAYSKKLEAALHAFQDTGFMSIIGSENAWRGFSLQALYICGRIANCSKATVFLPETVEDLLVVHNGGTSQEQVELVQIKSLKQNALHLSDLNPKTKNKDLQADDSFFGHVYSFWKQGFDVSAHIVVFGSIGREMQDVSAGFSPNGCLRQKMVERYEYPKDYCDWLKDHLNVEQADEPSLESLLARSLDQHVETKAAIQLARAYVMSYMHSCCRHRIAITEESWRKKLADLGLQASSVRGYLENYGHTIIPLSEYFADSDCTVRELETTYKAGANAMPEHIALGLDIERPEWQSEISKAFESGNVVVVRAPSGQGKSTACYRWLIDRDTASNVFLLNGISSDNAPEIAAALRGLATQGDDVYAYIEAGPRDGWVELCTEIRRLNRSNLKLLVSVREDDASRAGYDPSRIGSTDIFLQFSRQEAFELYARYKTPLFPSFESAWSAFGGEGPLLEFIYSLNHRTTLRKKLEGQVKRLRMQKDDACLTFLYLASVAGEYGLPSSIAKLRKASGSKNVQQTLEILENEMLLRSDHARQLVFPLHPYRSKLLVEIISPMLFQSEEELVLSAAECACGNFAPILIPYLSEHSFSDNGLSILARISETSWSSAAQTIKAMVWKDARRFYLSTSDLRQRMKSHGLPISLLSMLAGSITERGCQNDLQTIVKLFHDETSRRFIYAVITELSNRMADYRETDRLLSKLAESLPPDELIPNQASDAGFVLAYIGERGLGSLVSDSKISSLAHIDGLETLAVDSALDLLVGYNSIGIDISNRERDEVLLKTCQRDCIVWLDPSESISRGAFESSGEHYKELPCECINADGTVRQLNAIVAPRLLDNDESGAPSDTSTNLSPNDIVMRAVCDLRRLFPNRGRYCVQYSGVGAFAHGLAIPDCEKYIPEKNLGLNWTKLINQYYIGMCSLEDGIAEDWKELENSLAHAASDSIKALDICSRLINALLSGSSQAADRLQAQFGTEAMRAKEELDGINTSLPLCSRDAYAFTTGQASAFTGDTDTPSSDTEASPAFGLRKGTDSIFDNTRKFLSSLQIHFNGINSMILYAIGRGARPDKSSVINIADACSKMEACNSEYSKLFSGRCLISEKQKEVLLQHAAYWNYLWCTKSKRCEQALLMQHLRVRALFKIPEHLKRRLDAEADVISASLSDNGLIKVNYRAASSTPFSMVATRSIRDVLKYSLDADEHLLEWWILHNGMVESIEVTLFADDHALIRRIYQFSTIISHMDDPSMIEALSQATLAFDENNIACLEEAAVSFQATLETIQQIAECTTEVDKLISTRQPNSTGAAATVCTEWHESAVNVLNKAITHLNGIEHMYPAEFEEASTLINDCLTEASAGA